MPAADYRPKLPVRAAIYLLPDGTVHFGALFAELLPVARSLGLDAPISGTADDLAQRTNDSRVGDVREEGPGAER
jgi:hypothetical protein